MGYLRVIPRDLFNEANLLKCLGTLYILTEGRDDCGFDREDMEHFAIDQDPNTGAIYVEELTFQTRREELALYRPLNSRAPWPLWFCRPYADEDEFADTEGRVFTDEGALSEEFLAVCALLPD